MTEKIESLQQQNRLLAPKVHDNGQQMLSTNITDEISLLRSLAVNNHNTILANITSLSSKIDVVEANTILTLENKLQLQHSYVFGAKSIGLWDMDGNIPNPNSKV